MAYLESASGATRLVLACLSSAAIAWVGVALWNVGKPLPPGMHISSITRRVADGEVEFLSPSAVAQRSLTAILRAEQVIIVDQSPLPRVLAQALLERKHARPNLKVVVLTDPRGEAQGGTPNHYLSTLEAAGVVVARVRLDRLRDPNPLYSSLWRLGVGWWDDPFEDPPDQLTLKMRLRQSNQKADARRVLVVDDGSGGWLTVVETGPRNPAIGMHGGIARDVAAGELQVAQWSSGDDRLPRTPPPEPRGLGSVDARWLTEGAVRSALLDALSTAREGDEIGVLADSLGDRRIVQALETAAARGTAIHVLLDPGDDVNHVLAAELERAGSALEVRFANPSRAGSSVYIRHGADLWLCVGSTALTRRAIGDFNLTGNVELRMPQRAAAARAALADFGAAWNNAAQ